MFPSVGVQEVLVNRQTHREMTVKDITSHTVMIRCCCKNYMYTSIAYIYIPLSLGVMSIKGMGNDGFPHMSVFCSS